MMRSIRGVLWMCVAATLALAGCASADEPVDSPEVRAAVVAGLVAGHDNLPRQQVRTFEADLRGGWAAAYDPADPPGCLPGGLRIAGPNPCTVYVLQRRKNRWALVAFGAPGAMHVPEGAPEDLGNVQKLAWLSD